MPTQVRMSRHAATKVAEAGITATALSEAYNSPETTYASHRYPNQEKRIGNGLCLCVDKATGVVVTVFVHKTETDLRADQTDRDALRYGQRRQNRR